MLPSDHFVRMYNELFRMLSDLGYDHLRAYWRHNGEAAVKRLEPYFSTGDFQGLYDYWDRIRFEENCGMDMEVTEEYFELRMNRCPSLSKNLDNDAGLCIHYCEHCPGWINPALEHYGYYPVFDIISQTEPVCVLKVFKNKELADAWKQRAALFCDPYI